MTPSIEHNPGAQRFEASVEGRWCVADYRLIGNLMVMHHTLVPPALEGRGIAAALVHARREGLKVRPTCSYVSAYMRRHPETLDLLAD